MKYVFLKIPMYLGEGEIFGARTIEKIANAHQKCYVKKAIKVLNV